MHLLFLKRMVTSDPYCSCFYRIETFSWHTTLLLCLLVITQVLAIICSVPVKIILFMMHNDLYCLPLSVVVGEICFLKSHSQQYMLIIDVVMLSQKIVSFI